MLAVGILWNCFTFAAPAQPSGLPPASSRRIDFLTDIKPLLDKHCVSCHGPEKQKSDYRLDSRAHALKGGEIGQAILTGDSARSPLVHYVAGIHAEITMPPKGARLTDEQVGMLRAWIDQGANWPANPKDIPVADKSDWWSFKPIAESPPPKGAAHPIDAFILARLADKGLHPAAPADPRALLRRVYHDLIGLSPTPEEIDAFAADPDPLAYEKRVDALLASPRFGERWARHWLDTVHYGDTHGYDKDKVRPNAWPYRDYVIRMSEHVAARVATRTTDPHQQAELLCRLAYGRAANAVERETLPQVIKQHGLPSAARLILNSNEFAFID